MNSGLLGKTQV